eukprot:5441823-Pyramimonas_sp.AAC.1
MKLSNAELKLASLRCCQQRKSFGHVAGGAAGRILGGPPGAFTTARPFLSHRGKNLSRQSLGREYTTLR